MSHIYVVEFGDAGLVKVGFTSNPSKRLADHLRAGRTFFGVECRTWVSPDHPRAARNERLLIDWCGEGGEYVHRAFDVVVAYAQSLDFRPLSETEVLAAQSRTEAGIASLKSALAPQELPVSEMALRAVIEPDVDGFWRVRHDDLADGDRMVRLDFQMGLRTANLELQNFDGVASPEAARLLAYRLLLSAEYAEQCLVVEEAS